MINIIPVYLQVIAPCTSDRNPRNKLQDMITSENIIAATNATGMAIAYTDTTRTPKTMKKL